MTDLLIRPFTSADLGFAVKAITRERWTPMPRVMEVILAHDPDGCFVAEAGGRAVGLVTTTRYRETAWIGNLIVSPTWRRKGLGTRLMTRALDVLGAAGIRSVLLDADPPGINIYRRLGFVPLFDSRRFRLSPHEGPPAGEGLPPVSVRIAPLTGERLPQVWALDREAFGDDRQRLIAMLLDGADAAAIAESHGRPAGYALLLPTPTGVHLGPCVALDGTAARALLDAVVPRRRDRALTIAVPGLNQDACDLLASRGFSETAPSTRMVRGPRPGGREERVYAMASGATG